MRRVIKNKSIYYLIVIIGMAVFFACRKSNRDLAVGETSAAIQDLKSWLTNNGVAFATGEIRVTSSGVAQKGILNWSRLIYFRSGQNQFYEIPFNFSQNNGDSYVHKVGIEDYFPVKYSMVFQKGDDGNIVARLKLTTRNISNSISSTSKYVEFEFFDDVKGERKANWVWKSKASNTQPIRVYASKDKPTEYNAKEVVVGSTAVKSNYVPEIPNCTSFDVPNREYLCFGDHPVGDDYNISCGYYFTSYTRYTICNPGGNDGNSSETFDYPGYHAGSNGITNLPNKRIIDSLNGYPCAQNMLANDIFATQDVCDEVMSLFLTTYGATTTNIVQLTYGVDTSLTFSNLLNGYAQNKFASGSQFEEAIYLNPGVLKNATKEFTYSVMLHEGMHALIDFWNIQRQIGTIDSNLFKNMFPIFWDFKRALTPGELAQHEQMAASYISSFKYSLKKLNSSISDTMATALGWMGLQGTSAWKARTDTTSLIALQHTARRDAADSLSYNIYSLRKCP